MDITALFKLSSGLYIIGAKDNDKKNSSGFAGCVVNTVMQSTSKPVTLNVCINKDNYTNTCIKKTLEFSVSILSEKIKGNVLGLFGFHTSRDTDKFSQTPHILTPSGIPYLVEGVTGFIQCKVIDYIDNFTHTIFIAEAQEAENISGEMPLTYAYYHNVIKGKAPKNAPTFVEETEISKPAGVYKCSLCGYEYPGSKKEFENEPDDYVCPLCAAEKSLFEYK